MGMVIYSVNTLFAHQASLNIDHHSHIDHHHQCLSSSSLSSGKEPPLNAVMMLWVNLIMDTMGALGTYARQLSILNMLSTIHIKHVY